MGRTSEKVWEWKDGCIETERRRKERRTMGKERSSRVMDGGGEGMTANGGL